MEDGDIMVDVVWLLWQMYLIESALFDGYRGVSWR